MTVKRTPNEQAIVPQTPQSSSGYTATEPVPWYGRMRGTEIVEIGDEDEPRYLDGYEELRRQAARKDTLRR